MNEVVSIQATLNNSSNNFVVSWQLASGGPIINSIAPPKPYGNPWQVVIPGLTANVAYILTLWESPSTSPMGAIRNSTNFIPSSTTTTIRADDYLMTDVTSGLVNNTTAYVNSSYVGWTYDVERVGQGTMYLQGAPGVTDPDYAQDIAGGFHLLRVGDSFQPNEKFLVRFQPQVAPSQASNTGPFTTGAIVTASTVFSAADLNMAKFLQGSGSFMNLTLPPLSSVSDYQYMYFFSAGGSHNSAIITCAGVDKIQRFIAMAAITLSQNEQLKLFKANGVWNVDMISPTVDMVGEIIYRYNPTVVSSYGYNTIPADGSLLNRNTYWRLYQYFQNSGIVPVSETTWGQATILDGVTFFLNKGNWTAGTDGTNFRIPDLRDFFLRATTASIGAGAGASDSFLTHKHGTLTGLIPGFPNGKMPLAAAYNGRYYNQQNQQADLTGLAFNDPGSGGIGTIVQRVGSETAPKHTRIPILIRT